MAVHNLKTIGAAWDAVELGEKTFEVRRNDRFYQRGDLVRLIRLPEGEANILAQPMIITRRVGWMLQGGQLGIEPGFVVFSLEPAEARLVGDAG